ncbi:MAG: hypothetical protein J3R72DRAFT_427705 [Linnemannia gamsii]|nr:MAG: hypothetical protein J3R72DRAFT_427705 [Linnemannia gamsii]
MTTLRARDVFLYPEDFDPLLPVAPHHIPLEELKWDNGQATWTRVFKGEEFRTFWHTRTSCDASLSIVRRAELKGTSHRQNSTSTNFYLSKTRRRQEHLVHHGIMTGAFYSDAGDIARPKELILKRDLVGVTVLL